MGTRRDATTPPSPSTKIQPTGYHHHEVLWDSTPHPPINLRPQSLR